MKTIYLFGGLLLFFLSRAFAQPDLDIPETTSAGAIGVSERLIKQLYNPDADSKLQAMREMRNAWDPDMVEPLIALLKDDNPMVRTEAATTLGFTHDLRAQQPLITLLKDNIVSVRGAAASSFGMLGIDSPIILDSLLSTLQDRQSGIRIQSLEALERLMESSIHHEQPEWNHVIDIFLTCVKDDDLAVRQRAVITIGKASLFYPQDERLLTTLLDQAHSADHIMRAKVMEAFGRIGTPQVMSTLYAGIHDQDHTVSEAAFQGFLYVLYARRTSKLEDKDFSILLEQWQNPLHREQVVRVFGYLGDPHSVEPILVALKDKNSAVRRAAVVSLDRMDDPRIVPALHEAKQDPDSEVRAMALRSLSDREGVKATDDLIIALQSGDQGARSTAAWALVEHPDPRAHDALVTALQDPALKIYAACALGKIHDSRAVETLANALHGMDFFISLEAIKALGSSGDARAVPALLLAYQRGFRTNTPQLYNETLKALLRLGEPMVLGLLSSLASNREDLRLAAEDVLSRIPDVRAVPTLLRLLKTGDTDERQLAATALGVIADARSTEPLLIALTYQDPGVQGAAATALGRIGDVRAFQPLLKLLKSPNKPALRGAIAGLGYLHDPRAVDGLLPFTQQPDPITTRAAAKALGMIPDIRAALAAYRFGENGSNYLMMLNDPAAVVPLLEGLHDKNEGVRFISMMALSRFSNHREVEDAILMAAKDPAVSVRSYAVFLLGLYSDETTLATRHQATLDKSPQVQKMENTPFPRTKTQVVKANIENLKQEKDEIRLHTAQLLGQQGDPTAIEPLHAVLTVEKNNAVRSAVFHALFDLHDPLVSDLVAADLQSTDVERRRDCLTILAALHDPKATPPLLSALQEKPEPGIVSALGVLGDPQAVPLLVPILKDDDVFLRGEAVTALGRIKDRRAVNPLINMLSDPAFQIGQGNDIFEESGVSPMNIRMVAAIALGNIGDQTSVEPLLMALGCGAMPDHECVAKALGMLKDRRAVPGLIEVLPQCTGNARHAVSKALKAITAQDFGEDTGKWLAWWDKQSKETKH